MKTFFGALALTITVPAIAQTAPAATDPHAQHQGMDHSKHEKGKHDCKECCEKMKGKDGKMACIEKGEAKPASADSDAHKGHAGH
jgi:hypothetical protein